MVGARAHSLGKFGTHSNFSFVIHNMFTELHQGENIVTESFFLSPPPYLISKFTGVLKQATVDNLPVGVLWISGLI